MTVVIGTAGHIDHGKTTLLRALTGIDADRLPEERRRGLTIDIGYAHGSPDGGPMVDFVDVPGHDRLVGNMLVGVGEIDAVLMVVAADDGPRAQTWEHLGLIDAMGVDLGVVAVTKADIVDLRRRAAVTAEVSALLERTSLMGAPVVVVSGTTGLGLDALRVALGAVRDQALERRPRKRTGAWLAVDRAFVMRGHGVVVTGSSRGGPIAPGAVLRVHPGGERVRVRAVQVHDQVVDAGAGSGRVALNLAGVDLPALRRGQLLASPDADDGPLRPFDSDRLLVSLRAPALLPGRPVDEVWPPRDGTVLRLHIGTDQVEARLARTGRLAEVVHDGHVLATLRLARDVATAIGEPFVLRRPPPAGLLAGGVVLDRDVPRGRARGRLNRSTLPALVDAVADGSAATIDAALLDLHGARRGRVADDVRDAAQSALLQAVTAHQAAQPQLAGMQVSAARAIVAGVLRATVSSVPEALDAMAGDLVDAAIQDGRLSREGDAICLPGHEPPNPDPAAAAAATDLIALLDQAAPPPLSEALRTTHCPASAVRDLERDGRIVVVDDLAWSAAAYSRLRDLALSLADREPVTPAALRDASGTSRKYVMALLEDLDRRGILVRTPAGHVRGPRA